VKDMTHINRVIRMMDPETRVAIFVAVEFEIDEQLLAEILGRKAYCNRSKRSKAQKGAITASVHKLDNYDPNR